MSPPRAASRLEMPSRARIGLRLTLALLLSIGALLSSCRVPAASELDLRDTQRLRVGIGDRLSIERAGRWRSTASELERLELQVDFVQLWLTRDWDESWIPDGELERLGRRGIVPIVAHYFFGDFISRERFLAEEAEWITSLERMADELRMPYPVLVLLEPEFNLIPTTGETPVIHWPEFSEHLLRAIGLLKQRAPNLRIGICAGDFPGTPYLEGVVAPVAQELDFIAFQEMRADTDPRAAEADYLRVGDSAVALARYLKRAFDRPLLIGYVAVSSHGRWQQRQADALRSIGAHRDELLEAGVFGWVYFQLYDDPAHTGYFGAAERNFGLVTHDGRPKPAFEVFRTLTPAR